MPQSTPNLNLVTYDLTTDAGVYFSTFRTTLAGYTNSALTKIDTWAGQVNADLTTLKQTPSITRVSAIKQSDFIYSATIPTITKYSTNSFINLSLDNDNVGVVSLEINTLGGKSLLKYNSTGIAVNVSAGDLRKNKNNLFTYNGTAWIWVNAISSDQLNVVGTSGNLLRVSSSKTVEDSGVTYGTTVTNNNIVQRTSTGQIKGATASANDDVVNKLYADTIDNKIGALSSLTTTNKTSVVNAVNEVEGRDYSYGVPVQAFLPFENINAQFLGSYPPSYYAKQTELGTISSLTTTSKTSAVLAINELDSEIGNLASLTTTSKINLVGAINEVDSAIGQKADKTQISNPNLLINGDFQVWQRGTSFGVPSGFRLTADRWRVNNEGLSQNIIVAKEGNSFKFTIQEHTTNSSNIAYYFEKDFINKFVGEVLTLTVVYKNEFTDKFTVDVSWFTELDTPSLDVLSTQKISLTDGWIKKIVTFRLNSISQNSNSVHMQILRGNGDIFGYHLIKYAKLELGDIATPFSPRSYAEELAMCQRYYQYIPRIRMKTSATTSLEQKIPYSLPVVMRFAPTISYTGGDSVAFIETDYSENQILLSLFITNTLVDRTFTDVKLDAEIY